MNGKETQLDREMSEILIKSLGKSENPSKIYKECNTAKYNVSGLSTKQLLVKDAKYVYFGQSEQHKCVVSSMHLSFGDLNKRESVYDVISEWCCENNCVLWVGILPVVYTKTSSFKPILLFSKDSNLLVKISDHLMGDGSLQMERSNSLDADNYVLLHMNNVKASRKQVLPSICDCLKTA